jgi:hypothetical protein|tara:strand:- start:375 stop:542 length:168 start_codon:yes stop_codon:yes gene_type:complete
LLITASKLRYHGVLWRNLHGFVFPHPGFYECLPAGRFGPRLVAVLHLWIMGMETG